MSVSRTDETSVNLLALIQSGDAIPWQRLMHLYSPLIRYWCARWGVVEVDLDDVTQEVWLTLGPTLSSYQPGPGRSFRGWLRGVTHHKAQEWYRRRSYQLAEAEGGTQAGQRLQQIEAELNDDPTDPGEIAESQALYHRALLQVQNEFEPRTWQAFMGVAIEGKSAAEVGATLGLNAPAVRMAKCRVLNRLRRELGELLE